ncbi:MAG: hypothetical protein ACJ75S_03665 [Solirubrobacterales bacterium]
MQKLDRLLLHPNIQRLGGIQVLVSAVLFTWGTVKGIDPLVAAGVMLFAVNAVLLATQMVRRHQGSHRIQANSQPQRESPTAEVVPDRTGPVYDSAAVRESGSHLGQTDAAMQQVRGMFERARRKKRDLVETEFVAMINEGNALKGNAFGDGAAPSDAVLSWRESVIIFIGFALGDLERQRFLEVEPTSPDIEGTLDVVLDWLRQRRDNPNSWESRVMGLNGPELDAAIEARHAGQPSDSLADQIDSLMREGLDLVNEFSAPVEPEQHNGVWKVSGGGAPPEWQTKADAFRERAWELLAKGRPALLWDYRDACNDFLQKQQDAQAPRSDQDLARDERSTAEKVLDLATAQRSGPAMEIEACLEGLAVARHRLD